MRSSAPQKDDSTSRISRTRLLMLLAACVALLFFALTPHHRQARAPAQDAQAKAAYANRARWDGPRAQGGAAPASPEAPAIRGTIYDLDGRTVGGADVTAATFELAGNLPMVAGSTRSDPAGRFVLPLPDGTYQINASHEGYGPSSTKARTGEEISLLLPKSGTVSGHVYDEQHRPLRSFVISVISSTPGHLPAPAPLWSRTFDSADGSYRVDQIPMWAVVIRAAAPGRASAFSRQLMVAPGEAQTQDLVLSTGCTLSGRVQDGGGAPLAYVLVDGEAQLLAGSSSGLAVDSGNQVQTGTDGRFVLQHVPLGNVAIRAYDGAHAVTTLNTEIKDCAGLEPVTVVMSEGGTVVGTARDADGRPLPGARLTVSERAIGVVATNSDSQGRFRFDRLPPGPVRMELHAQNEHALVIARVSDAQMITQDIALPARGTGEIRGTVTVSGRPVSGMRLLIGTNQQKGRINMHHAYTGPDGAFRVTGLMEGKYMVHVASSTASQGVQLAAGQVANVSLRVTPRKPMRTEPDDDGQWQPAPKRPGAGLPAAKQLGAAEAAGAAGTALAATGSPSPN